MRRAFIAGNWKMNLDRASAVDLAEKVINCHDLLTRWLPAARRGLHQGSSASSIPKAVGM